MSKFESDERNADGSARERWLNAPIDWGRLFRGEPFTGPRERPLWYPMRATGRYELDPPEEIDQDTGEVTPRGYWEKRSDKLGIPFWWPVEAHRRAERSEYRIFGHSGKSEARKAVETALDKRAGKD